MMFNKSNNPIKIKKVNKKENREQMAKRLFETADAGFKNGSPWEDKHFYHTLEAVNSIIFTASIDEDEDEKIVGLLIASIAMTEVDIYMIVVDEAYKQKRIAYQLFEHLIAECRKREVERIFLEVRVSNRPAIGLYERLGFDKVGTRKAYYSSPIEDAIVMQLEL